MNSNRSSIDMSTFTELQDAAGADFVVELIETFIDDAPQQLQALRDALGRGDEAGFRRSAHTLKSNGNTFGALAFSALARDLELCKMSDLGAQGQVLLQRLEGEYRLAAQALKELRHAT
ncbi:Hpt domain-containing protein [Roseateles sp.]|uniref:Hpt domain-containing protein n=1 Tax=Roseateles sp. TaxID=1971397 RepID=UPI00286B0728|nr:Hpt domain-containing protein [Roseateles sp.]